MVDASSAGSPLCQLLARKCCARCGPIDAADMSVGPDDVPSGQFVAHHHATLIRIP